ncbi:single-strand DNA endonuclease 1-like [Phragmites australis]|uniref:single-strand DNA endonuclease 1-like n=1 Tax=Phragmites australis TaxID=29695 RepID=UPI002D799837|nr:single-strand DNA endonuclease 1-like [Phragmites australis]XP_062196414.1 single-strand DNA endonuclease 1-like [Phragmites australis]
MGVKNLWDILDSCKKKLPLQHLQNKKVCVDLSCWLVQLCSAHRSPAFLKDKVYLKNLFHRIRALLALNCSLIFVTDGAIPSVKLATYRRRLGSTAEAAREDANSQPLTSLRRNKSSEFSRMIKEAKHLGMALGIPCLDGVEEAEAQCALLDLASLCDGCFTSDSDSFLFGARTVYRDVFIGDSGYIICYEMEDIEKKLGFGRNSLISLAVLLGSDYSNGVHGFGPEAACRLVKSVGDDAILDQILSDGVKATRKCKGKNSGINAGKAGGICPKASTCEVGTSQGSGGQFRDVINAYLEPKCHSPDSEAVQRACSQRPFLRSQLQQICEQYFEWSPEKTDEYILPKIAERELRRFSNLRSTASALGTKPLLSEIPVPCPVLAIVKQRKVHGSEYYEVSWRSIDGLQVSVVPGDLVRSACPERITEFLEKKDEHKKQKRRARPKKSAQAAVKDVDAQLQELLLGIESESSTFPSTTSGPQTADLRTVAPIMDIVDLSSPSPPLRACKIARSRKFSESATVTMDGINLQCQSLVPGTMESQDSARLCVEAQNSTQDNDLVDLSSPLPCAAHKPQAAQGLPHCVDAERRALPDISNFPEKGSILGASCYKHEAGASSSDVLLEASPLSGHGTRTAATADCSWRSDAENNAVAEAAAIDLSSPSPVIGVGKLASWDKCRSNNAKNDTDVIEICEADAGSDQSPEHERKARELRLFLRSIRDELY